MIPRSRLPVTSSLRKQGCIQMTTGKPREKRRSAASRAPYCMQTTSTRGLECPFKTSSNVSSEAPPAFASTSHPEPVALHTRQ